MNKDTNKIDYGPSYYDFEFDFDLKLNLFDYALLGIYLVLIYPLLLLTKLARVSYQLISGKAHDSRVQQTSREPFGEPEQLISKAL